MQSNEVKGSYHMEKEGLHRVLEFLHHNHLKVNILVTDRHRQINKWLREEHPEVTHYYDVWHVAKGKCAIGTHSPLASYVLSNQTVGG